MIKQLLSTLPSDLVLDGLFDQAYAFQYIGYIIDPSLLHIEFYGRVVKVYFFAVGVLDQINELLCELTE